MICNWTSISPANVGDCFHRLKLRGSIRDFFLLAAFSPVVLCGIEELDGRLLVTEAQVWPTSNALPMGWSRSLFFAQAVNSPLDCRACATDCQ